MKFNAYKAKEFQMKAKKDEDERRNTKRHNLFLFSEEWKYASFMACNRVEMNVDLWP